MKRCVLSGAILGVTLMMTVGCRHEPAGQTASGPAAATADSALEPAPSTASITTKAAAAAFAALPEETRRAYLEADLIVLARVTSSRIDSVLDIDPPIFVHGYGLDVTRRLAGADASRHLSAHYESRDDGSFEGGSQVVVALRRIDGALGGEPGRFEVVSIAGDDPGLEAAIATVRQPAPAGLSIAAAQIPSAHPRQLANDYGDGEFQLTVTNDGDTPMTVPGLFENGGQVAWSNALVVRDEAHRDLREPHSDQPDGTQPVVLAPHTSISHRVDVKPFGAPRVVGGDRLYYSFGVGDLRTTSFFYFSSDVHGRQMGHGT